MRMLFFPTSTSSIKSYLTFHKTFFHFVNISCKGEFPQVEEHWQCSAGVSRQRVTGDPFVLPGGGHGPCSPGSRKEEVWHQRIVHV